SLNNNLFFTEEFFTSWQSEGTKIKVPRQLSHDVSLTYYTPNKRLSFSVEAKNITDELLYDNYSLQKAGRAFYAKLSYRFY
ncbi:MAG: TonB-dependent receptor, partial [Capnocytophaga ochracea]